MRCPFFGRDDHGQTITAMFQGAAGSVPRYRDPRIGNLGSFAELVHQGGNRGLRAVLNLVLNHLGPKRLTPKDTPVAAWSVW
jgi:hypothetical protein